MGIRTGFSALVFVLAFGSRVTFGQQAQPLDYQTILESVLVFREAADQRMAPFIEKNGVNFNLSDSQARELKDKGAPDALLGLIRDHWLHGTVQITCRAVNCEVFVNGDRAEQKTKGLFIYDAPPGMVVVKAQAAEYFRDADAARVELNRTVELTFDLKKVPIPITTGTIVVVCEAGTVECVARLDGGSPRATSQSRAQFDDVNAGIHRIDFSAEGFLDKTSSVTVKAGLPELVGPVKLAPEPPRDAGPDFQKILAAVGQEPDARLRQAIQVEAKGTINGKQITYVESLMMPFWARWDLTFPEGKMIVHVKPPAQTVIDGDSQTQNLLLPSDLIRTFEAVQKLSLTQLIPMLQDAKYQKTKANAADRVLVATGPDGSFTITYNERYLPTRIQHRPYGGGVETDMTYGHYAKVGGWTLPFSVIVRFSDKPTFVHDVQYTKYYLGADLKQTDFDWKYNKSGGIGMWFNVKGEKTKCFTQLGFEEGRCKGE